MTDEEHQKLIEKLGETLTEDFITRLDNYKASTGKTYKSDYATILNWSRKEPIKKESEEVGKYGNRIKFDVPKVERKARTTKEIEADIKELGLI